MSLRKVSFVIGEYYHLYNRGNSKQIIFRDNYDSSHFLKILYLSNTNKNFVYRDLPKDIFSFDRGDNIVSIGAYCLMPNHFHILITEKIEGGISKFMQKLTTAYSMYYNKKYNRTGVLFEGKFKSQHLNSDEYLKYIFSYIHLNPIKLINKDWKEKGIVDKLEALKYLEKYKESSYCDYLGQYRQENQILDISAFPDYFPSKESFDKEIFDWLAYKDIISFP